MEKDIIITPEVEEQITTIEKEQGMFPQGTIDITSNGEVDVSSYATANVDVDFNLQDKDVSITQNGTNIITADEGYMGMSSVNINTNVPAPKYAPKTIRFSNFNGSDLLYETQNLDTTNLEKFTEMFYYCQGLIYLDCSQFRASTPTDYSGMFYYCFRYTGNRLIDIDLSGIQTDNNIIMSQMFYGCSYLKSINLSNITKVKKIDTAFRDCYRLETLDISKLDFSNIDTSQSYNYNSAFSNCGSSLANGELTKVYVKDAEAQQWILNLPTTSRPASWSTANVIIKS